VKIERKGALNPSVVKQAGGLFLSYIDESGVYI
jgi:hypothetical protein